MAKKKPNPDDVFVGQRVRVARNLEGKTQEWLGLQLNLTFQQVQKYEKGTNRIGSSRMMQIAKALNRPVSWFYDEQPNGKNSPEGTDLVTKMLSTPYGVKLATSYVAIKHNHDRHVVAEVARALAHG